MQVKKELGFCLLFLVGCLDVALRYENAAMIKSLRPELHINTFWRAIDPLSSSSKKRNPAVAVVVSVVLLVVVALVVFP